MLLIIGLFAMLAALLLTINLVVAIVLVKVNVGFLSPQSGGVGAHREEHTVGGPRRTFLDLVGL